MQSSRFTVLALAALLVCGCTEKSLDPNLQYEDARNPYVKKAEEAVQSKNYPDAVKNYEAALVASPKLAQPHYELGRIYSDRLADPICAMYHYQKFLAVTSDADKKQTVQTLLENEKITFAALAPNSPIQNAEAFAKLQSENANLKKQVEEATTLLAHKLSGSESAPTTDTGAALASKPAFSAPTTTTLNTTTTTSTTGTAPATPAVGNEIAPATTALTPSATVVPTNPGPKKSYTIKQGDSLWKISSHFYPGDAKNGIEKIKQANKDVLPEGKPLKIGTVITIP